MGTLSPLNGTPDNDSTSIPRGKDLPLDQSITNRGYISSAAMKYIENLCHGYVHTWLSPCSSRACRADCTGCANLALETCDILKSDAERYKLHHYQDGRMERYQSQSPTSVNAEAPMLGCSWISVHANCAVQLIKLRLSSLSLPRCMACWVGEGIVL